MESGNKDEEMLNNSDDDSSSNDDSSAEIEETDSNDLQEKEEDDEDEEVTVAPQKPVSSPSPGKQSKVAQEDKSTPPPPISPGKQNKVTQEDKSTAPPPISPGKQNNVAKEDKSTFAFVFSEEEEIILLERFAQFRAENGLKSDWVKFHSIVKDQLSQTKTQISEKMRRLRQKFERNFKSGKQFTDGSHEFRVFELSRIVWAPQGSIVLNPSAASSKTGSKKRKTTRVVVQESEEEEFDDESLERELKRLRFEQLKIACRIYDLELDQQARELKEKVAQLRDQIKRSK